MKRSADRSCRNRFTTVETPCGGVNVIQTGLAPTLVLVSGLPKDVFDGLQAQLAVNRSIFYRDLAAGAVLWLQPPGAKASEAIIQNWWRQGMMGGAKAHYDGIVAFSQTDFTEDLKKITVPVLVMHGDDDDQIVPYARFLASISKAAEERDAKDLQGLPAWHANHPGRHDQCRPVGLSEDVALTGTMQRLEPQVLHEAPWFWGLEFHEWQGSDGPQYGNVATLEAAKQAFRAASDRRPTHKKRDR